MVVGVLLVGQPRVLVDEGVAVVRPLARHPPHLRRPRRDLRLALTRCSSPVSEVITRSLRGHSTGAATAQAI